MPLYTLWSYGTPSALILDVLQCTGANTVIALGALAVAIILTGTQAWPTQHYVRVALLACGLGVAYTLFSEWLNVEVLRTWAYSDLMPVIPGIEIGLSPLIQWIAIPLLGFWWARHRIRDNTNLSA